MAAGDVAVTLTQPSSTPCASFDGVDDYIELADNTALRMGTAPFTVSCWVRQMAYTNQGSTWNCILSKGALQATSAGFWGFFIDNTNKVYWIVDVADGPHQLASNAASVVNDGTWHSIVGTRATDGTMKLYFDGVDQTEDTASSTENLNNTQAFRVGNDTNNARDVKGLIKDVRVWNLALTAAEVTRVANGETVREGELVLKWKLDGNATDSSGRGFNGTTSGAVFIKDCENIDVAVTAQRTTVGSIAGTYALIDVANGTSVMSVAIDEA